MRPGIESLFYSVKTGSFRASRPIVNPTQCQLIPRPWQNQHSIIVRDLSPLHRLEHVIDHPFIAIRYGANIDLGYCAIRPIEMRVSLEMIL
jgi:hypothetical protein